MAETRPNPEPSSGPLHVQNRRTARLHPWLLILFVLNFATLILAGVLSNTVFADPGPIISLIWWAWLLQLIASGAFLIWRLSRPPRLYIGPEGIKFSNGRLQVAYNWSEIAFVTIATRRHLFGHRPTVCLRSLDNLGPEVVFAQHLSGSPSTLPFRDQATGWIVVCNIDQFGLPAAHVQEALAHYAGPRMRTGG
ncbi:hypothetical protein [Actinomadura rudentiformis]|uniref:PH domain-containing protein n=1 Tax=Actinomadura rudentiformis TaxID=359158 RepID=A0A6H9YQY1_9ACTN|nr:hypothetical protein [Actinomadura rudentiformis]KAB2350314.1 hypothetical protein F8566_11090 [Actinomadura rudentiformis]